MEKTRDEKGIDMKGEETDTSTQDQRRGTDPFMSLEFYFYLMSRSPLFVGSMVSFLVSTFLLVFYPVSLGVTSTVSLPVYGLLYLAGLALLLASFAMRPWKKESAGKRYHGTRGEVLGKLLLGKGEFNKRVKSYMSRVEKYVNVSAENGDSLSFVSNYVGKSLAYIPLCAVADLGVYLSFAFFKLPLFPFFLIAQVIWATPLLMYEYPYLHYRSKANETSNEMGYELPFFVFLASIASSSGLNLSFVYRRIHETSIFKGFKRESDVFVREVRNHGRSLIQFVDYRARTHPLKDYAALLYAYSSVFRAGGGIQDYLNDKAKEFINVLNFRWSFYADRISSLGETIIIAFLVFPTLFLVLTIFGGLGLIYALIMTPPFFMVALYAMVRQWRPKTYDDMKFNSLIPVALGITAFAVGLFLGIPLYVTVYVSLLLASVSMYVQVRGKIRDIKNVEDSLPQFLRDLTEYKKIGYSMNKSLSLVSSTEAGPDSKLYKGHFREILSKVGSQIRNGTPMNEVDVKTPSWMGRFTFMMLGLISESGNVSTILMEELTNFTRKYVEYKKEALSKIRLYQFLGIATPILLTFVVLITVVLLSSFGGYLLGISSVTVTSGGVYTFHGIHISQQLKELMFVFIEISSFFVGLILGKATSGTVANSIISIVGLTIALIGIILFIHFEPSLASLITPQMS